jgi:hypothetical protein
MPSWKKVVLHGSSGSLAHLKLENLTSQNVLGTDANGNVIAGSVSGYSLPVATSSTLGGIKVGNGLTMNGGTGVLSVNSNITASKLTVTADSSSAQVYGIYFGTVGSNASPKGDSSGINYFPFTQTTTIKNLSVGNNISVNGTVDGRDIAGDGTKLDGLIAQTSSFLTNTVTRIGTSGANLASGDITVSGSGGIAVSFSSGRLGISSTEYSLPIATAAALGGVKIGSGINIDRETGVISAAAGTSLSADRTNFFTGSIALLGNGATSVTYSSQVGGFIISSTDTDTTYSAATTSTAGLMSSTDKTKLDGIAASANNYSLPIATASALGGIKIGSGLSINSETGVLSANVQAGTILSANRRDYYSGSLNLTGDGATTVTYSAEAGGFVISSTDTDTNTWRPLGTGATDAAAGNHLHDDRYLKIADTGSIIDYIVASAPGTLDTLNELAAAIGDDANFSASIAAKIASKADASHTHSYDNYGSWTISDRTNTGAIGSGNTLAVTGAGATSVSYDRNTGILTISSTDTDTNTTYSDATQSTSGLLSSTDKKKLDGIAASANNYSLPVASASTLGGIKVGTNLSIDTNGVLSSTDTNTDTTYSAGTGLSLSGTTFSLGSHTHTLSELSDRPGWFSPASNMIAGLENFNNSVPSGFYEGYRSTNAPSETWYNLINVRHSNRANDHGFQIAASYYDENIWTRTYQGGTGNNNGTFTTWRSLVHSGNIGSQSVNYAASAGAVSWTNVSDKPTIPTNNNQLTNGAGYITSYVDTITSVGISGDLTSGNITLAGAGATSITKSGGTITITSTDTDTTYSNATTERAGLMSTTDKTKLDGIAASANNYSLPKASATVLGGIKIGTNLSIDTNGVVSSTDTNTWRPLGTGATDAAAGNHTHDDRYYTETESDTRFARKDSTDSADLLGLVTVNVDMTLRTDWQATSIRGNTLSTGTYIVQVYVNDYAVGGGHYTEYYSGTMSWYGTTTNSSGTDEIVLHRAGHAPNSGRIYLRTKRTAAASDGNMYLEMAGDSNNTGSSRYVFKFRRLI